MMTGSRPGRCRLGAPTWPPQGGSAIRQWRPVIGRGPLPQARPPPRCGAHKRSASSHLRTGNPSDPAGVERRRAPPPAPLFPPTQRAPSPHHPLAAPPHPLPPLPRASRSLPEAPIRRWGRSSANPLAAHGGGTLLPAPARPAATARRHPPGRPSPPITPMRRPRAAVHTPRRLHAPISAHPHPLTPPPPPPPPLPTPPPLPPRPGPLYPPGPHRIPPPATGAGTRPPELFFTARRTWSRGGAGC